MELHLKTKLSVICWNAQSILNKTNETFSFLKTKNIDIALITETWLKQNHTVANADYKIYRRDRLDTSGGGVAILIRNHIKHELLPDLGTSVIETIGVRIIGPLCNMVIISAYFPGSMLNKSKLELFRKDLQILSKIKSSYFIGGDLNSKHRFWNCSRANQAGKILYDEMSRNQFFVHFPPTPTYYPVQSSKTIPSTLDIVLSNDLNSISNLQTVQDLSSDHLPIMFEINYTCSSTPNMRLVPCYSMADWSKFKSHLNNNISLNRSSGNITNVECINNSIAQLTAEIKDAEALSIPIKQPTYECSSIVLPKSILSLMALRNCYRRRWQRNGCHSTKLLVKSLNCRIQQSIRTFTNDKFSRKIESFRIASKQFWQCTKLLTNKAKIIPPIKSSNNKYLFTDLEKAEEIASTFSNAHRITINNKSDLMTETNVSYATNFIGFLIPEVDESTLPTYKEILTIIKKLKSNKSPGVDNISNQVIKQLPKKAIIWLTYIFRACFRICYFPQAWKQAKVISILKPGKEASLASSYRPISLLNAFSKILEKLIVKRLNSHILQKNIFLNEQFGFRAMHSTSHQLARVSKYIKCGLQNKKSIGMITFDVEKAFDAVWHNGLLYKMKLQKFPLHLIKLTHSFLSNRNSHVLLNGAASASYETPAGVPQGSVLSPTLYNLYTSDLKFPINGCELALFADDTAIYTSAKNPNKIIKKLIESADYLTSYCNKWKIKLNTAKTQAVFFTRKRGSKWLPQRSLLINDQLIPWKNELKYLGVILDKTLTFKSQTQFAGERALKYIKILYPLINRKSRLNICNKILLYKSIFQSILLYGCPVWGKCAFTHRNKLQIIQNKCLKIIMNKPWYYSTRMLHSISNVSMIDCQIEKITNKFTARLHLSPNILINDLATG